jgi:hypothetical protein
VSFRIWRDKLALTPPGRFLSSILNHAERWTSRGAGSAFVLTLGWPNGERELAARGSRGAPQLGSEWASQVLDWNRGRREGGQFRVGGAGGKRERSRSGSWLLSRCGVMDAAGEKSHLQGSVDALRLQSCESAPLLRKAHP